MQGTSPLFCRNTLANDFSSVKRGCNGSVSLLRL